LQSGFVERTISDINHTLEQSLFAEKVARQKGALQSFDPRLKLAATLLLLIAIASSRQLLVIFLFLVVAILAVVFSKIPLAAFVKRVLLFALLFTGVIVLPSLFLTPGPVLRTLPMGIIVTRTGALSALFLMLRVTASISWATLLVLTTPWNDVLKVLGAFRLPDVIVLILGMTYRYIHLLLHEASDMFLSRKSRLLKKLAHEKERELLGATGGVLLGKSLQMSEEVYLAMQSRGYHHYPRTMDDFKMRWRDWLGGAVVMLITVCVIVFGI
jgi:cobalt/nickel transport system permease protein